MHNSFETSPVIAGVWRLGEWGFDTPKTVRWIEGVLDLGISTFDHADIYGGYTVESRFGQALAATPGLRQRLKLITKCGIRLVSPNRPANSLKSYDSSRAHIRASVESSLRALSTDRIDLLLIHRPDFLTHPDEIAESFRELAASGKVLHFGVSNHSPDEVDALNRRHRLVTNQIEFSPLQMGALSDGTLRQCTDIGMRPMAWSPLGGGRLFTGTDETALRVRAVLEELGARYGVPASTMGYAWVLRHPSRPIPIAGSRRIAALGEAMAALNVKIDSEDWYRVWRANTGHDVP